MTARRFDLHLHTDRSDGKFSPDDVVARALASKLDAIAVTDHDLFGSVRPGEHRDGDRVLRVIPAAELSGTHEGHELHLLVYFRDDPPAAFVDRCTAQLRERARRYDAAVARLQALHPTITLPAADDAAHGARRSLTRHHLADALVAAGVVATQREAFERYVGGEHAIVPPFEAQFVDLIREARSWGAITAWAHPPTAMLGYAPTFAAAGLHALEMFRPGVTGAMRRLYRRAAQANHLFATGGSDWHGTRWDGALGSFWVERADLGPFVAAIGS